MPLYSLVKNPLEPRKDLHSEQSSLTPSAWLAKALPVEALPLVCAVNGKPLPREDWDKALAEEDVVVFVPVVGYELVVWIVVIVVSVIVSVAVSGNQRSNANADQLLAGDIPKADPVFDLRGQRNSSKLGQPIEACFGRHRNWPSYAAAPYSRFVDNDSWLFQLFCLGHGEVRVEEIYIEDTPLSQFQDVTYELIQPGGSVTLFADNVFTSAEVVSIELFGPNEQSYTGWSGGYVAVPEQQVTEHLEVDLILPRGLYQQTDSGSLAPASVAVTFEARQINDNNLVLGAWFVLGSVEKTLATTTPQRFTLEFPVSTGRYEVRATRTSDASNSHRFAEEVRWGALRAFLPPVASYPGITLLALKARATNNLNDSASARCNYVGTRKLRAWNGSAWSEPMPTRSPVWAFVEIVTAAYGGSLSTSFLDLPSLLALDSELAEAGIFFDWVFERGSSLWDALKTVSRVCRGHPMLRGSQLYIFRERPLTTPRACFSASNITANSFSYEVKLRTVEDHDGLEVVYLDPETWLEQTVACLAPGDAGQRKKTVKLLGCTSRVQAYRYGMYMRLSETMIRENIQFRTGMEGLAAGYGALVALAHEIPAWGFSTPVEKFTTAPNGVLVHLAENVTFAEGPHYLALRRKNGDLHGPVLCYATADERVVRVASLETALFAGPGMDPPFAYFGKSSEWAKLAVVKEMRPAEDEDVEMKCIPYTPGIFAYDNSFPPPIQRPSLAGIKMLPRILQLDVFATEEKPNDITITWQAELWATSYVLAFSRDNVVYEAPVTVTALNYAAHFTDGPLWIRLRAVSSGAGPAFEWHGTVGALLPPDDVGTITVSPAFTGLTLAASWSPVPDTDAYLVQVFARTSEAASWALRREVVTELPAFTYAIENAVIDGRGRYLRLLVSARNLIGWSENEAELLTSNPVPAAATLLSITRIATSAQNHQFLVAWELTGLEDLDHCAVWTSPVAGFALASGVKVYQGTGTAVSVLVPHGNRIAPFNPSLGTFAPVYFRIVTKDRWGDEVAVTDELSITVANI